MRKVYVRFKDNIWAADSAEMESFSSKNRTVKYLLSYDLWMFSINMHGLKLKPLDKKCKAVLNAFMEILNESNRKPNKFCVNQGKEFYNELNQEWLVLKAKICRNDS